MGLDVVELVIEVEGAFEISIADSDYSQIATVGDLHQYILRQLDSQHQSYLAHQNCPSVPAFLAARRAITTLLPVSRKVVRPTTQLAAIIPKQSRRHVWQQLQVVTHIRLPPLVLPSGIRLLAFVATVGMLVATTWACIDLPGVGGVLFAALIFTELWITLFALSRPLASEFPSDFRTVADMVRAAKPPHYPSQRQPSCIADSEIVWKKLVAIIVSELAVSTSEVTPDARFVEDLRLG